MRRRLVVLSLTLAALTIALLGLVGLWHRVERRGRITERHWASVRIAEGNLAVVFARATEGQWPQYRRSADGALTGRFRLVAGKSGRWAYVGLTVPVWSLVAVLVAYPAVAFIRGPLARRRRAKRNRCLECAYDLTGNVSGRCPECGARVPGRTAAESFPPDDRH